jgi:hypothetical protein
MKVMFDDEKMLIALQQIARIKHLELLLKIEKEGMAVSDKIDAHMPMIIVAEIGYYLDDYGCDLLERLIDDHKEGKNV